MSKKIDLSKELKAAKRYRAKTKLKWFIDYTMPKFDCQWFNDVICEEIDEFLKSKTCNKLAIFLPPQNGKSETVSRRLPAYILGQNPDLKVVAASYSHSLSSKFNRDVQRIIDSKKYRELFSNTRLKGSSKKKKETTIDEDDDENDNTSKRTVSEFEIVGHSGCYKSCGIGGGLTGETCDFGIIDDPIKDSVQANSKVYRDRLWDWYNDVFLTRLHNDSKIIYCQTRWHDDDLWSRISKRETGWKIIVLPGLREEVVTHPKDKRKIGEALWEAKHSAQSYREAQQRSPRTFASLIQQRPAPEDGNIFQSKWFRYYSALPPKYDVIQSWDCTFKDKKDGDYVVGTIWGKSGTNLFLLGIYRGQWDFVKTVDMFKKAIIQYPNSSILVEDKANGSAIISVLRQNIPGIIAINPKDSKETRAYAITQYFEAGNIYFPRIENAPWVEMVINELKVFPNGAHDDIVDTVTQVIKHTYLTNNSWSGRLAI